MSNDCPCGLPPQLKEQIARWLKSNNKTHYEVRYGGFPLGMVQGLIEQLKCYAERVTQLEQKVAEAQRGEATAHEAAYQADKRAEAAEASLAHVHEELSKCDDIKLDQPAHLAIAELQKARREAESSLAALKGQNGWVSVKERLPEDDSAVFAAIWWKNGDNPVYSHYEIHDCLYYEGGPGSGQKIFADCEGEEFEHADVDYWIYKKDLVATLPSAPPADKAEQGEK